MFVLYRGLEFIEGGFPSHDSAESFRDRIIDHEFEHPPEIDDFSIIPTAIHLELERLRALVKEPKPGSLGQLIVETDDDFSLELNGMLYIGHELNIVINSIDELDAIKVLGPYGSDPATAKRWEIDQALRVIKAHPDEFFANTGGNRGAEWYPTIQYTTETWIKP